MKILLYYITVVLNRCAAAHWCAVSLCQVCHSTPVETRLRTTGWSLVKDTVKDLVKDIVKDTVSLVKQKIPNLMTTHCFIEREALAQKH